MPTMTAPSTAQPSPARPWYREPYVWMVVGGPLAVVVASIVTVTIAVRNADTVLPREAVPVSTAVAPDRLTPEERLQAEKALLPANQGRNHAVSSALPKND